MARILLDNISLTFKVRQDKHMTAKDYVIKHLLRRQPMPSITVPALRNVNLQVGQGERIGLIGHNGAGKSTMLKLLAGIYPPTEGTRIVEGRISSLFDIVLGFEPEASGWENIAYRCYLQGETPRSVKHKQNSIADFAELGDKIHMPVRYYSAGMTVRLAFAIATAIDPEILLIDEVLSAGDLAFQHKARQRMTDLMARAHLIVTVSHDLVSMAEMCDRIIWMDHGQIRQQGPSREVIAAYQASASVAPVAVAA